MSTVTTARALTLLRRVRRLRLARGSQSRALLVGVAVASVAAFGVSWAQSVATPGVTVSGGVSHWGGSALEGAFVASVLAAAVVCFRALDALFHTDDARALALLPIPGAAITIDRVSIVFRDAFVLSAPAAGWALGALSHSSVVALFALAFVALGALLSALVALGSVCSAAVATVRDDTWIARGTGLGELAKGGAVYQIAPGLGFGAAAFLLLFCKLGIEEPLRVLATAGASGWTNAASFALGIPFAVAAMLAISGLRGFAREHARISARYAEVEQTVANVLERGVDERAVAPDAIEQRLARGVRAAYRKDRLQLARSAPFVRAGSWAIGALSALAVLASDRVAPVLFGLVGALWLIAATNPVRRLRALAGEHPGEIAEQLIAPPIRAAAATLATARELLAHLLPLLLPAAVLATRAQLDAALTHTSLLLAAIGVVALMAPRTFVTTASPIAGAAGVVGLIGAIAVFVPWLSVVAALAVAAIAAAVVGRTAGSMMEKRDA